jgi:hypothetical protein
MDNPDDDHDPDASLPAVGRPVVTAGITRAGMKDSTAFHRGKSSPWAAGRNFSAYFEKAITMFLVFY